MNRTAVAILMVALLICTACSCKDNEPPRRIHVEPYKPGEVDKADQEPEYACFGEETDEEPEVDISLNVVQEGEKVIFEITAAETKGLRVCGIWLNVRQNVLNEDTGEWEWNSRFAPVLIPRLEPHEVRTKVTPRTEGEFPDATKAGPPEAWTIVLDRYADVRKP